MPKASSAERARLEGWWRDGRRLTGAFVLGAAALALGCALSLGGCGAQAGTSTANEGGSGDSSAPAADQNAKIQVVASFYPMADFAEKVGGDRVEVKNLVPAGTEPHEWEPAPQDIRDIEGADVFVYNGADMETWVDDALASLPQDNGPQVVEASDGLTLRAGEEDHDEATEAATSGNATAEADHEHEGEHDPHVWLAPENAKHEAENIKNALVAADPDHESEYEANYEAFAQQLDDLDRDYRSKLAAVPNKTIVVSHEAFGYLCDAYGLSQVPITGMDAEGEPDAQTMASIIEQVKAQGIKTVFSEDLVSPKVAQQIADATGATCEVLNPCEGLTDEELAQGEDYLSVMHDNLDKLVKALS